MFRREFVYSIALAISALLLMGCGVESDLEDPHVDEVELISGDEVIAETTLSFGDDNTLSQPVPLNAEFGVVFSEPVSIDSVKDRVVLRSNDESSDEVELSFEQNLKNVVLEPVTMLQSSTLYVLEIEPGIEDTSGNATDLGYRVNFQTMEAP